MAWEEWERLKTTSGQTDAGDQAPRGDLVAGQKDLAAVGKAAHDLFEDFHAYSGHARVATEAAAGGLRAEGFALGPALSHVAERWTEQTRTLLDACAHISNHLRFTRTQHAADDTYIAGAVSSITLLDEGFDDRKGS
ncbi:hypothetical protein [Streptomyces flavalbus]|uniref:AG1 protein n=1 Tax=Streptomyces flavalbus TaxID=2665155 RepID=A0ABW2WDW2_9ACTN